MVADSHTYDYKLTRNFLHEEVSSLDLHGSVSGKLQSFYSLIEEMNLDFSSCFLLRCSPAKRAKHRIFQIFSISSSTFTRTRCGLWMLRVALAVTSPTTTSSLCRNLHYLRLFPPIWVHRGRIRFTPRPGCSGKSIDLSSGGSPEEDISDGPHWSVRRRSHVKPLIVLIPLGSETSGGVPLLPVGTPAVQTPYNYGS